MLVFALPRICILAQTLYSWWAWSCELPESLRLPLKPRDTTTGLSGGAECCICVLFPHLPSFDQKLGKNTHVSTSTRANVEVSAFRLKYISSRDDKRLHHSQCLGYSRGKVVMDARVQFWNSVWLAYTPMDASFSVPTLFFFSNLKYANMCFWKSYWKLLIIDSVNKASENREEFHMEIQHPPSLTTNVKSWSYYYPHWSYFP